MIYLISKNFLSGNEIVDSLYSIKFYGNVIPTSWYKTIVNEKGKPQIVAINILADIVYWYRPTIERDEETGYEIGLKKKFKDDFFLQRNYDQISEMLKISRTVARNNVVFLEKNMGVIERKTRNIIKNGQPINNVMFIKLNVERLLELTFEQEESHVYKNIGVPLQKYRDTPAKKEDGPYKNIGTNTEITTNTTSNNISDNSSKLQGLQSINQSNIDNVTLEDLKEQISYDTLRFEPKYKRLIDDVLKIMFSVFQEEHQTYQINGSPKSSEMVKNRFRELNQFNIESAIDGFSKISHEIHNAKMYWVSILYNCEDTTRSISYNSFATQSNKVLYD